MADINRIDKQPTAVDFRDKLPTIPNLRGIDDWMERDRFINSAATTEAVAPLLPASEVGELQARWNSIQADFVDEPRRSVKEADKLVATAVQRVAEGFARERASLEKQWDSGDNVSTEDLRIAFQRYRAFFSRLLNAA